VQSPYGVVWCGVLCQLCVKDGLGTSDFQVFSRSLSDEMGFELHWECYRYGGVSVRACHLVFRFS
jgi:hypothetical protein